MQEDRREKKNNGKEKEVKEKMMRGNGKGTVQTIEHGKDS